MKWYLFFFLSCFSVSWLQGDVEEFFSTGEPSPIVFESVNVLTGEYWEEERDLTTGGVDPLFLRRSYVPLFAGREDEGASWFFNYPNFHYREFQVGDLSALFSKTLVYETDKKNRLSMVKRVGHDGQLFDWLKLIYGNCEEKPVIEVESSSGQRVVYAFHRADSESRDLHALILDKIHYPNGKVISYHYCPHPTMRHELVAEKRINDTIALVNVYDDTQSLGEDPLRRCSLGKIIAQKAPVGSKGELVVVCRFEYEKGVTRVFDANGGMRLYRFNERQKITAIESYLLTNDGESLYRKERYFWDEEEHLVAKVLENGQEEALACRTFEYNAEGQKVRELLYGNLSGYCSSPLLIDDKGEPQVNGIESVTKVWRYSLEGLILEENQGKGLAKRYFYTKEDKLAARFLINKSAVVRREFFSYDEDQHLVEVVVDDGRALDVSDVNGVTQRQIVSFTPSKEQICAGHPIEERRAYFDRETGEEVLWQRLVYTYSPEIVGDVQSRTIYDETGATIGEFKREYDVDKRTLYETDAIGVKERTFDLFGNLVQEVKTTVEGKSWVKKWGYDSAQRIILEEIWDSEGHVTTTQKRYDIAGNLTATIDSYGNETQFCFDDLGRLIEVIYPAVLNSFGNEAKPVESFSYDCCGRKISVIDPMGFETKTEYNLRGQPLAIFHPDGTYEKWRLDLYGNTISHVDREGRKTEWVRDSIGRLLKEIKTDREDRELLSCTHTYQGFYLISSENSFGDFISYTYDGRGRKVFEESFVEGDLIARKAFSEELMGQQKRERVWFGDADQAYTDTVVQKDLAGDVIQHYLEDASGQQWQLPLREKEEQETRKFVEKRVFNERGQCVRQQLLTDECGLITRLTYDALGRLERCEVQDLMGEIISRQLFFYDLNGNRVQETHGLRHRKVTRWQFGPNNRLERLIEAWGTPSEKVTEYRFDLFGRQERLIKADGTCISYLYDAAGRLEHLDSSNRSVSYSYTYDKRGRLIEVKDQLTSEVTKREYNGRNQVVKEQLAHGYSIERAYDLQGRMTKLRLEDSSSVDYLYDAFALREVTRISPLDEKLYTHNYREYDSTGRVLVMEAIASLGEVCFERDERELLKSITTPYWEEEILSRDCHGNITQLKLIDPQGEVESEYGYDCQNQLVKEEGTFTHEYSYDSLFNRRIADGRESYFDDDQLLMKDGFSNYKYDLNGNMIERTQGTVTTRYSYDALNRLVTIDKGSQRIKYNYDPFNRRVKKSVLEQKDSAWNLVKDLDFVYDGVREIGMRENAHWTQFSVLGLEGSRELGNAVALELEGEVYFPIHDHRGSLCCLVNVETKTVAEYYRYSAYGEEEIYTSSGKKSEVTTVGNPWRFASKRKEIQSGFIYFNSRDYDPASGRFLTKDPLGFPEGPNRFAFCQNNPLNRVDPTGLFSLTELWESAVSTVQYCVNSLINMVVDLACDLKYNQPYWSSLEKDMEKFGSIILGRPFLYLSGYFNDRPELGAFGNGEVGGKVRITMINGILTLYEHQLDALDCFSRAHGGINIHYVYRPTEGLARDLMKALYVKMGLVSSEAVRLSEMWRRMIREMGGVNGGGIIIHYAHSLGGTDTAVARELLTKEERKMLHIVTMGSATLISTDGIGQTVNYISWRDGIPLLGSPVSYFIGLILDMPSIVFIGNHWGIPGIDHPMNMDTYRLLILELGALFVEEYGHI